MVDLPAEINRLRDRHLAALDELHDDHVHTRSLWRLLRVRVRRYGETLEVPNPTTGSHFDGEQLAGKAGASIRRLSERSFKDTAAQFELFTGALTRLWLMEHPDLVREKALDVATLLASKTLAEAQSAAIRDAVDSTVFNKTRGKPTEWFNYLRTNLGFRPAAADQGAFVEMKARRDVLEHANGVIEATYLDKAGSAAKYTVGDRIDVTDVDVGECYRLVRRLIADAAAAAVARTAAPVSLPAP